MNFARKLLTLCIMAAMMCLPASADEDISLDMSLLMFGRAALTVYVDGELSNSLSDMYVPGDSVTIKAPDVTGKTFTHWADSDGKILSYNDELTLTIYANTVLNAVYGTESVAAQPYAGFLSITSAGGQIKFNVIATAPSGSTITEYGIRYSTTKKTLDGLKGDDDVTAETAGSTDSNWLFGAAASDDTTYYAVTYVTSGGQTYYSDVQTVSMSDLDSGVASIADIVNLLLNVSLDNVSDEALEDLQAMLFTVSFDANNGTGVIPPQGFVKDIAAALTANTFTRNYYTFRGWNTSANGKGTSYQDSASVSMTANTTLYAQWQANTFTLNYELNGAADPGNPSSYTVENTITLTNPTKEGYDFTGWTGTDIAGTSQTVTIPAGSTGARSYTANFTPITYTISYDLDGGTNASGNPTSYTIETATITLHEPTREGYTFMGWLLDGETVTEIATGSTGSKGFTASWQEIAPVMTSATYSLNAKEGETASLTISATGVNLSWDIDGALPAGLDFSGSDSTATISGTPEAGTSGTYSVSVSAMNNGGSASADVVITVAGAENTSGDVESGDIDSGDVTSRDIVKGGPVTTIAEDGSSTTTTTTTLKDSGGNIILCAEIAITTDSENFAAVIGEEFTTRINVDVKIDVHNTSHDEYTYLMEIFGLPEWLAADGTLESSGTLESEQHYEFTLTGTPTASQDAQSLVFAAAMMISGDTPEIEAYADKEVMLAVYAEGMRPDVSPDVSPDVTPGTDTTPDNQQEPGQDVTPDPVVIDDGKITINPTSSNDGTVPNIAEVVQNMTSEEKQSITKLEVNSEVQSLEWLSELENLEELTLNENASTEELDISGSTSIKEININKANVKTLNLAGCENLESLDCSSSGIESINLDGCTSLKVVNISNNSLMKFDAGTLGSLQELICDSQVVYVESIGKVFALWKYLNASSFMSSESGVENVKNLKAFDKSGNEIAADFESGTASFSESPAKITYDYDTGFNGVMMDVTIYAAGEPDNQDVVSVGSSGGGCNSAFGMMMNIFAALILILLKFVKAKPISESTRT